MVLDQRAAQREADHGGFHREALCVPEARVDVEHAALDHNVLPRHKHIHHVPAFLAVVGDDVGVAHHHALAPRPRAHDLGLEATTRLALAGVDVLFAVAFALPEDDGLALVRVKAELLALLLRLPGHVRAATSALRPRQHHHGRRAYFIVAVQVAGHNLLAAARCSVHHGCADVTFADMIGLVSVGDPALRARERTAQRSARLQARSHTGGWISMGKRTAGVPVLGRITGRRRAARRVRASPPLIAGGASEGAAQRQHSGRRGRRRGRRCCFGGEHHGHLGGTAAVVVLAAPDLLGICPSGDIPRLALVERDGANRRLSWWRRRARRRHRWLLESQVDAQGVQGRTSHKRQQDAGEPRAELPARVR
mmetsp:Transcript_78368/g.201810  ORF Transcript_78368/g.201810 Transcript_78368/m.201810 type:complete len:366 (-) Transcript_78368:359-1456(-)